MTRKEAMEQAIKEAELFCNQYDPCPYGRTFEEFRTITAINFFNKIYDNSLQATIEAQEIIIKDKTAIMEAMAQPKTCDGCIHFRTCNEVDVMCVRYYELTDKYEPKDTP